ncbi:hypothetical protein QE370_003289 [Aeromicrobium sp. SORGH_AS981]|jgi:hypothetical protein|uniref:hypothetical protein n=1 Tax=Aeromicrobium sp. SORGH_AS_0981 TaxID=3041802 RepID=UPI00286159F5|nr:hypothetical protein [Aeromicrobium sp. SORGH_AS_0981]MDR6120105.1 hypothetical protein [Aeromicrobium sp. SORGH_AS_0981]
MPSRTAQRLMVVTSCWRQHPAPTSALNAAPAPGDDYAFGGHEVSWYVRVRNGGLGMVAGGGSGSPVCDTYANGEKQARGIILAGDTTQWEFQDHNPDVTPTCYSTLIYVPISVALNKFGYTLETD